MAELSVGWARANRESIVRAVSTATGLQPYDVHVEPVPVTASSVRRLESWEDGGVAVGAVRGAHQRRLQATTTLAAQGSSFQLLLTLVLDPHPNPNQTSPELMARLTGASGHAGLAAALSEELRNQSQPVPAGLYVVVHSQAVVIDNIVMPVVKWLSSGWGECSAECGEGLKARTINCSMGSEVACRSDGSGAGARPSEEQVCEASVDCASSLLCPLGPDSAPCAVQTAIGSVVVVLVACCLGLFLYVALRRRIRRAPKWGNAVAQTNQEFLQSFIASFNEVADDGVDFKQSLAAATPSTTPSAATAASSTPPSDVISDSLQRIADDLEPWLQNRMELSASERTRYEAQLRVYKRVVEIYRLSPDPLPDAEREEAQRLFAELHDLGQLPDAVVQQTTQVAAQDAGGHWPLLACLSDGESSRGRQARDLDDDPGSFTYYFLLADRLRSWTPEDGPVQSLQELRSKEGWLTRQTVSLRELLHGEYSTNVLLISHRWNEKTHPDKSGTKLVVLKTYLMEHAEVNFVWMDYPCLPQGKRSKQDKVYFGRALETVNMLYLGCHVLILFDFQYVGRFWTSYEAWLAMQAVTAGGLVPAADDARYTIVCLGASVQSGSSARSLQETWKDRTPEEVMEVLKEDDIIVTNMKDKVTQLRKLSTLQKDVMELW